jgi:hypothetical protein
VSEIIWKKINETSVMLNYNQHPEQRNQFERSVRTKLKKDPRRAQFLDRYCCEKIQKKRKITRNRFGLPIRTADGRFLQPNNALKVISGQFDLGDSTQRTKRLLTHSKSYQKFLETK